MGVKSVKVCTKFVLDWFDSFSKNKPSKKQIRLAGAETLAIMHLRGICRIDSKT